MYDIKRILPHREPMIFIKQILMVDLTQGTLTAKADTSKTNILYDNDLGGIPVYASLEYMAQGIGCFAGIHDITIGQNAEPKAGFIIGSRKFELFSSLIQTDKDYFIDVQSLFCDNNIVSFLCRMYNDAETIAKATINAYRPEDVNDFISKM